MFEGDNGMSWLVIDEWSDCSVGVSVERGSGGGYTWVATFPTHECCRKVSR